MDRRTFLGAALALASTRSTFADDPKRAVTPQQFRERLVGPILSFPTTYTADFKLDFAGTRTMIERALAAGVRVFTLTRGNNQYDQLSCDEVKALTKFFVETVAGRGLTIAATGPWWTGQIVDYARFAKSLGADALQVSPPVSSDDGQFTLLRTVASACGLPLVLHSRPSIELMKRLLTIDEISGFKAEYDAQYTLSLIRNFAGRLALFAGGQKSEFLAYQPYGMRAYYSTFATFAPDVAMRFWRSVRDSDLKAARDIVMTYDVPFFDKWSHPFWRATLEHFGVAARWVRPPEQSFTDAQMREVKTFFDGLGLRTSK